MNTVSLPLKWKIIGTNTFLLLITIVLLVQFASSLFNEDKSATVYENTLENSLAFSERFQNFSQSNQQTFELLLKFLQANNPQTDLLKTTFSKNANLVAVASWRKNGPTKSKRSLAFFLENDLFRGSHGLEKGFLLKTMEEIQTKEGINSSLLKNDKLDHPFSILTWKEKDKNMVALFHMENVLKELSRQSLYDHFLWWKGQLLPSNPFVSLSYEGNLQSLMNKGEGQGSQVKKFTAAGANYVVGLAPSSEGAFAISVIKENVIFKASSFLRQQSLYFGFFILALTVFAAVLLSRSMTSNLAKLHDASVSYAQGHFENDLTIKSRDEIGSLAITFKKMGQDILRYIEEMKDKARMEKEIEVAKLVQESFIPQEEFSFHQVKLSSYYRPTSECSGDWWGTFTSGDHLILVVADATGHGVPAALMTATASGCLHQLEYELNQGLRDSISAAEILKVLNFSIARMGGKIHMTAFAMVIDTKTGVATYGNASHNAPLFVSKCLAEGSQIQFDKGSLIPLMDALGPRLGEKLDSNYEEKNFQLEEGDYLFIYSDGLVEQENDEGKQWGQRRFMKEMLGYLNGGHGQQALTGLPRHLLEVMQDFSGRQNYDDDITLLSIGFFAGELSQTDTSRYQFLEDRNILITSLDNDKVYGDLFKDFPFRGVWSHSERWRSFETALKNSQTLFEAATGDLGELVRNQSASVSQTEEIESVVIPMIQEIDDNGYFSSPKEPLGQMARELTSNALFHQQAQTSDKDRKGGLAVGEGQEVRVEIFQWEEALGFLVEDQSGRLTFDTFRKALQRAYEEKKPQTTPGGAGLGLYMIFDYANKVFIDVKGGESTQILTIIEKEKRYKKYKAKTTELYFRERTT